MVDTYLPLEDHPRPLGCIFLDLNSYFASVEQQEQPELRGRPTGVVPLQAETTFLLAASYEAKAYGVRTGTRVDEARRLCPDIALIEACPPLYTEYHKRVVAAMENVLPVEKKCSIDEMRFRLLGEERQPARAREIALEMKRRLRDDVGEVIRASIGIAPNAFLAKIATNLQKPDGLITIEKSDLPKILHSLPLRGFTGINYRMQARLNAAGLFSAVDLCAASKSKLREAFGSIVGERWWYLLRGYEFRDDETTRKSLGHSHVLAPHLRHDAGCRAVLLRLLQKASARLRSEDLWASEMSIYVSGMERSWHATMKLPPTQDTVTMNDYFLHEWENRNFARPLKVAVTFTEIRERLQVTPSLFEETAHRTELMRAVDRMNQKYGKNRVHLAGMHKAQDAAPERIAFGKTELFSEGKGDNEWIDTFRGPRTPKPPTT